MADPQVRRSFDPSIPKYAPGSVEVKARIVQGEQGIFFESADEFVPRDEDARVIDDADGKREKKRTERLRQKALDKVPHKLRNPSNLQVRVRTGVVYIGVTLVCMLVSDVTAALYLALLSAICAGEFYYMLRSDAKLPNELIGITAAALFPLSMWLFGPVGMGLVFVVFCLVLLVWYVFWLRARIADVAVSLFGALYTGMAMSFAMLIKMAIPDLWGGILVLGIFLSIWGNDAFAYLVGSAIGKHKLAPAVSPKKSWEGFIAGLIFSMGLWCALTFIPGVTMSLVQALIFGFICGILGVLGDLVESRIKRNSGFKDSGTIMPGHGGLLDRCDSQFLVTVSAALLLIFGGCIPYVWA